MEVYKTQSRDMHWLDLVTDSGSIKGVMFTFPEDYKNDINLDNRFKDTYIWFQ